MPIAVGSIVTVVADGSFTDCQGTVIAIVADGDEDGPIEVEFGEEWQHTGHHWSDKTLLVRFLETDLRVDACWDTVTIANRLYKGRWHSAFDLPYPFLPEADCMIEGCPNKAVMRGICNVWGSVYPVDFCPEHQAEYHGMCGDSLPPLKPNKEAIKT